MSATGYRTICVKGNPTRGEGLAGASTVTPGELLQGAETALVVHASAAGAVVPKRIALESRTNTEKTTDDINIDYASGETVYFADAKPGEEYYMFLKNGENASVGSMLQSDGAGALQVLASAVDGTIAESIVGRAKEALNNTTGAAARILVEII